jgi:hypothetical protein
MAPRIALLLLLSVVTGTPRAAQEPFRYSRDFKLCQAIRHFAERSAGTGPRVVRIQASHKAPGHSTCRAGPTSAGQRLCDALVAGAARSSIYDMSQNALACIGYDEPRFEGDENLVTRTFWTGGTFESRAPHFAQGKVHSELSLGISQEFERPWVAVHAVPAR